MESNLENMHYETVMKPRVQLAGRGARWLAQFIDSIVFIVIYFVSFISLPNIIAYAEGLPILTILVIISAVLGFIVYQGYLLTTRGQTVGKIVMGIKIVMDDTNENGGFVQNWLIRYFANYLLTQFVPFYGLIDVLFIFGDEQKCLHDRMAGTKVIVA